MKPASERVREALAARGFEAEIVAFPEGTRTAAQAARAVGCHIGQIVKSLVFMAGGEPLLLLVSGANRVDAGKRERLTGRSVRRAEAELVRSATGFAIGGVPPVGHARRLRVYMDRDLMAYRQVWAAAGTPHAVFGIQPQRLQALAGAEVVELKEERG